MEWVCASCECENGAAIARCEACDEERPSGPSTDAAASDAPLICCAVVTALDPVPGKGALRLVTLDAGRGRGPVQVVSSAPNLSVGARCVVALPGAELAVDGEAVTVKAAAVGGVRSNGMLCDSPMLRWAGGGAGTAALLPDGFAAGDAPPPARPRLK